MRNSFIIKYGVGLWLASIGLTGPLGAFVAFIAAWILGDIADRGIIVLDLSIDSIRQALSESQWRDEAKKAYDHAVARVYTEAEKNAIRQEYLDALSKFASYGDGLRNDQPPEREVLQ